MPIPAIIASVAGGVISSLAQYALGSTNSTATSTTTSTGSQSLGKDDFMRLMVAQLQNQDPLNPMDNTQFVAQTAQFTSLEQLQNMNAALEKMAASSGSSGVASASALLGKMITVNGSPLTLDAGGKGTLAYALPGGASAVSVRIIDGNGNTVRTLNLGQQGAGTHQIAFDGLDDQGRQLAAGTYTYQVAAADSAGRAVAGACTGGGQVTGISVENGGLMLVINNQRVPLTSVVGVMAGTTL